MTSYSAHDRQRWVAEDPALKHADRDDFARDRARLVHSAALRRLSGKTQVHKPGRDDFVRNRLTHSLEVAQIGREFGAALGCNADVVDTACLAHDLGHPPFGHNGELALDLLCREIGEFEGNAQTLRLLTRLEAKRFHSDGRSAGLNLTRASLDASIKYPWPRGGAGYVTTKFGVYEQDRPVFDWIREEVPAPLERGEPPRRCIEAQAMDWADDVAYSVHDVEDGVTAGLIDPALLRERSVVDEICVVAQQAYGIGAEAPALAAALDRALRAGRMPERYRADRPGIAALKDTTSRLIGHFVQSVEAATRARYGTGRLARYDADVVIPEEIWAECIMLKAVAAHFVILSADRQELLATQRDIIGVLYAGYQVDPQGRMDEVYREDYLAARTDADRARVVVDQVASLTDERAIALANAWT